MEVAYRKLRAGEHPSATATTIAEAEKLKKRTGISLTAAKRPSVGTAMGYTFPESGQELPSNEFYFGLFSLTVTVTTRGTRNYNSPLIRSL